MDKPPRAAFHLCNVLANIYLRRDGCRVLIPAKGHDTGTFSTLKRFPLRLAATARSPLQARRR